MILYNIHGQIVYCEYIDAQNNIMLNDIVQGVYFICLRFNGESLIKKLVLPY